jgi:hypothetical protein
MATAKKAKTVSRASLMRQYYNGNPNATPVEVAKKFKTTYQIAYMVRKEMQKPKKQGAGNFKRIAVFSSNKPILNPEITIEEIKEGPKSDPVNHPAHYKVGGIETIDFIEAKALGYHLGNAVKYITRADHKGNRLQDLQKAKWYIDRAIEKAGA